MPRPCSCSASARQAPAPAGLLGQRGFIEKTLAVSAVQVSGQDHLHIPDTLLPQLFRYAPRLVEGGQEHLLFHRYAQDIFFDIGFPKEAEIQREPLRPERLFPGEQLLPIPGGHAAVGGIVPRQEMAAQAVFAFVWRGLMGDEIGISVLIGGQGFDLRLLQYGKRGVGIRPRRVSARRGRDCGQRIAFFHHGQKPGCRFPTRNRIPGTPPPCF